ncbi:MAG: GHKL domain-containing protein [Flavobacteriales bacterium]|nr:GHKL domain-containing protein [Flavobacteriales bacterium]
MNIRIFTLFLFWCSSLKLLGSELIVGTQSPEKIVCNQFLYFIDSTNEMSLENLKNLSESKFSRFDNSVFNFGFIRKTIWLKTNIRNKTDFDRLMIEIGQPNADFIEFYVDEHVETFSDMKPFSVRKFQDAKALFEFRILPSESKEIYFKIRSSDELIIPIYVNTPPKILQKRQKAETFFGVFFGIMLVMIFYNLFIYFSLRTQDYLLYVINILFLMLGQGSLLGYLGKYLWPNSGVLSNISGIIFPLLSIIFGMWFVFKFLNLKYYLKWSIYIFWVVIVLSSCGILLAIMGEITLSSIIVRIIGLAASLLVIYMSFILLRWEQKEAKFLLVAWSVFLIGVILYVLKDANVLPYHFITIYAMPIGAALETLLLAFALANSINILKVEREESQRAMLNEMKKNHELINNQSAVLESKVTERTEELQIINEDLKLTLDNLKSTQGQLVEAEKMASLGHLTAGIAHEINNPINFVSSNVKPIRQDLADVLSILDKYNKLASEKGDSELMAIIEEQKKMDIDYSINEMNELLDGIEEGAKRTAEIVTGLKNFSRTDEDEFQQADVNNGLKSTVAILKSELNGISVHLELGSIPHIDCFLGKLNQVFMNLIDNAIDAIREKHSKSMEGILTIRSEQKDDWVVIKISDNGSGMPEEVKNSIFDPFFTTKEVGKGTGLGLSISYGIIEKHHGHIFVESEKGKGTTFVIELPIKVEKEKVE